MIRLRRDVDMTEWTPGEIARYDQMLADANAELDLLVQTLRLGAREVGDHQALLNVGAFLGARDHDALLALLTVAVQRISNTDG